MSTMKAVYISKPGGVEALQYVDIPIPQPKQGEVLVKNEYIGVNFIDTYLPVVFRCDSLGTFAQGYIRPRRLRIFLAVREVGSSRL